MTETLNIPPKLEEAIQNNNLVFFVGAGCSLSLDFPSWKKLIEDILEELNDKYGTTSSTNFQNILTDIKNGKPLFDALNKIEHDNDHGPRYKIKTKEFINTIIDDISKKLPEESILHSSLWKISKKIITTNYDSVLEKYKPNDIALKIFDNTNAFQGLKSHSEDAQFLYKIHGDYDKPESIILFESDYRDMYKNENYNNDILATHFKGKTLLFVGFSLTDPFVNDLFSKIKAIYNGYTINEHFIFTTKNEDFTEYDVTTIQIEDWNKSLLKYLTELENIKLSSNKTNNSVPALIEETKDEDLTKDDVSNILDLINKKTKELKDDISNKELHTEVRNLQTKLNQLLFKDINYLQEVDKPFRNTDLQTLFDVIYSTDKLDALTLERIQKVRNNTEIYKWYDRSVIVSAITCSLIHFNKADEQKITLLIDFINDNEEKVWQKAIASLFMALNHLGNKWLRFTSIKIKIKSLNQNSRIQDACSTIIQLFNIGLNNVSMISEDLFNNSYFSENPFNYFLPYHQEENPAFDLVYDNFGGNDIEEYITFLNQVPIPDQLKYLLCNTADQEKNEENNIEKNKDTFDMFNKILHLNSVFHPYSIYIQEIISFYKYFPIFKHEEKLKSQLKLTETPLKDYLLNAKQKYSALGCHFMQEKNWTQAIVNFKEAVKLDENNIPELLNLANCYYNNKDFDNEFLIRIKVQDKEASNENNLCSLFDLYLIQKKDYKRSLEISNQLLKLDDKNADYFYYRGLSNKKIKNYKISMDDFNLAISLDSKNSLFYANRADIFYDQKEYSKANVDLDIAISIDEKEINYFLNRATNNLCLLLFDDAFQDIKRAESLNTNKEEVYNSYGNYYRLIGVFDKAFDYIEKAEKLKKQNNLIGTKAAIYASMGDDENFYKYLEMALIDGAEANSLYPDIKEKYNAEPRFSNLLQKFNQQLF